MFRLFALFAVLPVIFLNVPAHAADRTDTNAEGPVNHTIRVVSDHENLRMYFKPKLLHIHPGDTVTWVNEKNEDHNIMTYPDGRPQGSEAISSPFLKKAGEKAADVAAFIVHVLGHKAEREGLSRRPLQSPTDFAETAPAVCLKFSF